MSDIDLTEAVEAAARDHAERQNGPGSWATADGYVKHMWREGVYREVSAALPHIERQVLRAAAQALYADATAERGTTKATMNAVYAAWLLDRAEGAAARIARGDS